MHLIELYERRVYHVGVIWIQAHVGKRVESCHGSKSQVAVQLGERIVNILAGLHIGQRLWR